MKEVATNQRKTQVAFINLVVSLIPGRDLSDFHESYWGGNFVCLRFDSKAVRNSHVNLRTGPIVQCTIPLLSYVGTCYNIIYLFIYLFYCVCVRVRAYYKVSG